MSDELSSPAVHEVIPGIQRELERVVQGQDTAVQHLLVALTAGGHVLLEGVPGVAKTLLARCLAASLESSFQRIQFTPDLMPSDITGVNVFEPKTGEFRFRPGPIFADMVMADEINRAPPKTQSALLEAMQEMQVSIDGEARELSPIFMVVATQNPIEYEGTYPLPEAQLDRFLMKIDMPYPSEADERNMLRVIHVLAENAAKPASMIKPVANPGQLTEMRRKAHAANVDQSVLDYILTIIRRSRNVASMALGGSPRSAVMLLQASKALAFLRGKDYVSPDDVQAMALPVLRHRIKLTPEAEIEGLSTDSCIESLLSQVDIPR
jgi:MoxR-like ATPase